jgi:hypothetical protein
VDLCIAPLNTTDARGVRYPGIRISVQRARAREA